VSASVIARAVSLPAWGEINFLVRRRVARVVLARLMVSSRPRGFVVADILLAGQVQHAAEVDAHSIDLVVYAGAHQGLQVGYLVTVEHARVEAVL
jgi:hypothetical protein